MNLLDFTPSQLNQAAAIKEQIEELTKELHGLLGVSSNSATTLTKKRVMSASVKRKIAAAQKARWANLQQTKPATQSVTAPAKAKKKKISPTTRAKLSAKLKAYWAARKTRKK
jgi:hypothetical protein